MAKHRVHSIKLKRQLVAEYGCQEGGYVVAHADLYATLAQIDTAVSGAVWEFPPGVGTPRQPACRRYPSATKAVASLEDAGLRFSLVDKSSMSRTIFSVTVCDRLDCTCAIRSCIQERQAVELAIPCDIIPSLCHRSKASRMPGRILRN